MREISPAENLTVDEFLQESPPQAKALAEKIRASKQSGNRPVPSTKLIDRSTVLSSVERSKLLDRVALLVDENLFGRSEMCIQFSILLSRALKYMGLPSRAVAGIAMYYKSGREIFRWNHSWVRIDSEVVDGNVDILSENPSVPDTICLDPYWGPITSVPPDRRLREDRNQSLPQDTDVEKYWWVDLKTFVDTELIQGPPTVAGR
jgi:hypothetical protein